MNKLEIQNLNFAYGKEQILFNISSEIALGEVVAVVGPNGSGKSTYLKCLNRILKPQKGCIFLDNNRLSAYSLVEIARKMAYVPQNEKTNLDICVFDMVLTGRKPYMSWKATKEDLEIVSQVLHDLELDKIAMKSILELSGGQLQLVSIARAIAQEPEILILDEPTANLDIQYQLKILNMLKKLSQKRISIIFAIHEINLALRIANRFMMIKEGEVFAQGGKEIINPKNLEQLYGVRVHFFRDGENLYVIPKQIESEYK